MLTCLPRLLALTTLFSSASQASQPASKGLIGLTTGNDKHPAGELVQLDPQTGKIEVLSSIVSPGGQRHGSDVLVLPEKKGVLVTVVELGDNRGRTFVTRVEIATGKTLREWAPIAGPLDALCQDDRGAVLAMLGPSRPCQPVRLDLEQETTRALGVLDKRLWLISLCFDGQGQLWGLHMRTPELDHDALVRLDRTNGALLETVKLDLPGQALALEIDARGRFLISADKDALHEVDPKSGKSTKTVTTIPLRIVGLDRQR